MFGENKNLRNSEGQNIKDTISMPAPYQAVGFGAGSYTKTSKLITALYMVTDIMDKDEPIRNKLRTLGLEILSDPEGIRPEVGSYGAGTSIRKIEQIISLLDIASAMNFISEMNSSILKKEFLELKGSIQELDVKPMWLEEFLNSPLEEYPDSKSGGGGRILSTPAFSHPSRGESHSKGHTRIGVQKGSTLMQALRKVEGMKALSDRNLALGSSSRAQDFDILKKQRRDIIINIIKNNGESSTIKDIKTKMNNEANGAPVCSEKTLQRELMSMTKDGVLNKTGEKRWSRYFLK